jgi:glycosyltransferase involved in cell wall biosynthesis
MIKPLISICIPAYKKPQYVVRCLESIIKQDYKLVEVIISDDSPDEDIKVAIQPYLNQLTVKYFHNKVALKTPKNWNAALDKGTGDLLLLLHQDDWFHSEDALSTFVKGFEQSNADFVFCQNTAIDEEGNKIILQAIPSLLKEMDKKPNHLLLAQVIGPPSNTMIKRSVKIKYDERFIWLVDVDYYSRMLKAGYKYKYINRHLVSIGLHEDQTTVFCRMNSDIIFKENIWFANKLETNAFKDIYIYDYYWRLLRNYKVRSIEDIRANNVQLSELPGVIKFMLNFQKRFPLSMLKNGIISKFLMTLNYLTWKLKSNKLYA